MKKLLLLLLLPVCVLGQEEKPRKLFFEIKQGVGLPSIGLKYKNNKGDYWNVGVNTYGAYYGQMIIGESKKTVADGIAVSLSLYDLIYLSYSLSLEEKINLDIGLSTISTTFQGSTNYTVPFIAGYYGNKISIGLEVFMFTDIKKYLGVFASPKIKFRI